MPIYTGDKSNRVKAVEQIQKTFAAAKSFKVGSQKQEDPSVTAVAVTEIIPSQFASLLGSFSIVVNDDDIGDNYRKSATLPNGIMLHQYTDVESENRQALYYGSDRN